MIGVGATLGGKYRLEAELGSGAMGSVWRALNLQLEAPVAIKLMNTEISEDAAALARFQKEAHAGALVRSPHVLSVFDHAVDAESGHAFIVMELLEGESLGSRLKQRGRLSPQETAGIVAQACRGLQAAHSQGIVHRDLKPDNLFLVADGEAELVKILDFGIAKTPAFQAGPGTQTGVLLGTPYYMSPEQIRGARSVDARSDLWSLAVIVYQCLSGQRPFQGDTIGGLALAICTEPIPPLSSYDPGLKSFDGFFERALAREPAQRIQSASELSEQLRRSCEQHVPFPALEVAPIPELHANTMLEPSRAVPNPRPQAALAKASFQAPADAERSKGRPPLASAVRHHRSPALPRSGRRAASAPTSGSAAYWLLGSCSVCVLLGAIYWGWQRWSERSPAAWLALAGGWLLCTTLATLGLRAHRLRTQGTLRAGDLARRLRLRVAQGSPRTDLTRVGPSQVLLDGQVSGMPLQLHFERPSAPDAPLRCELRAKLRVDFSPFEVLHRSLPGEPQLGSSERPTGNPGVDSAYRVFTEDAELSRRLGSALDGFYSFQDVGVHLLGQAPLVRFIMHANAPPRYTEVLARAERLNQALLSLADAIHPQARNSFSDSQGALGR